MSNTAPSLATGCAALRRSVEAIPPPAGVSGALHAMFLAMLLRLLDQLGALIADWHAGRLAHPGTHPHPTPRAKIPRPLRRGTPDIIIAQAHALPPRDPARPARATPPRTRAARDPPCRPAPPSAHRTRPSRPAEAPIRAG